MRGKEDASSERRFVRSIGSSKVELDLKAVVFAAGKGERLWPLTENKPKPLLPVGGKPVIERTLEALIEGGIRDVLVVVNFRAELIKSKLGDGQRLGCKIHYIRQRSTAGTADALKPCREALQGEDRFILLYGDDYYGKDAVRTFAKNAHEEGNMMMGAAVVEDPSRFGSLEAKDGLITSVREKVAARGPGLVNAGMYLMDEYIFPAVEKTRRSARGEFELTDSIRLLISQGKKVRTLFLGKEEWLGITYPWDLLEANKFALKAQEGRVVGEIEDGVTINGKVIIEKGSVVRSGSYLEGPLLLGEGSRVGPGAYLRPHTTLGRNAKVGAGCEVKNSVVMDEAKIPHLSYVGDSILGEGSSLGAGTITANLRFDEEHVFSSVKRRKVDSGGRKLGAVLGENVRTGINVSLMPGVKIGSGAWIGAGLVVKRDVPSGARIRA